MNGERRLLMAAADAPGARRFFREAAEVLGSGRHLVIAAGHHLPAEVVREAIFALLFERSVDAVRLSVDGAGRDGPSRFLASALGIEASGFEAPSKRRFGTLPDVLWLEGIDGLEPAAADPWFRFLERWSARCHQHPAETRGMPVFGLSVHDPALLGRLPKADVRLATRAWWGALSATEARLLIRGIGEGDSQARRLWREHVLPSLAGADLDLAECLWDVVFLGEEAVYRTLIAYGERRGWRSLLDRSPLRTATTNRVPDVQTAPDGWWLEPWAHGAAQWTCEYGPELNTALHALRGEVETVRHRLWRGQAALLLPFLDEVRLQVCRHLTRRHGASWPHRWIPPHDPEDLAKVRADPNAAELGHISYLLKKCAALGSEGRWAPYIERARVVRNHLAHYRPVPFSDYEALLPVQRELR